MMPFALAISVWGLVTGVAMVNAGMTIPSALAVHAVRVRRFGAARHAAPAGRRRSAAHRVDHGAAGEPALRHLRGGVAELLHPKLPWQQRLVAGYLNGDLGFALFTRAFADDTEPGHPRPVRLLLRRRRR